MHESERPGGVEELLQHLAVHGADAAVLGRGERWGEREVGEGIECRAGLGEAGGEVGGLLAEQRLRPFGPDHGERVAEQLAPLVLAFGLAAGDHEGLGLAPEESVLLDRVADRRLLLRRERGEGVG